MVNALSVAWDGDRRDRQRQRLDMVDGRRHGGYRRQVDDRDLEDVAALRAALQQADIQHLVDRSAAAEREAELSDVLEQARDDRDRARDDRLAAQRERQAAADDRRGSARDRHDAAVDRAGAHRDREQAEIDQQTRQPGP